MQPEQTHAQLRQAANDTLAQRGSAWFLVESSNAATPNEFALINAARRGDDVEIRRLHELGTNLEVFDDEHDTNLEVRNECLEYTPVCLAAKYGYVSTVRLLLEFGAQPRSFGGSSLLRAAVEGGFLSTFRIIPDEYYWDPHFEIFSSGLIHIAARLNKASILRYLVEEHEVDPEVAEDSFDGLRPVEIAASRGCVDSVRTLCDLGVDLSTALSLGHQHPAVISIINQALSLRDDQGDPRRLIVRNHACDGEWKEIFDEIAEGLDMPPPSNWLKLLPPHSLVWFSNTVKRALRDARGCYILLYGPVQQSSDLHEDRATGMECVYRSQRVCVGNEMRLRSVFHEGTKLLQKLVQSYLVYPKPQTRIYLQRLGWELELYEQLSIS